MIDKQLVEDYGLDKELVLYALDKNKRAHLKYNAKLDRLLLIFNLLDITKEDNYYETTLMAFIVQTESIYHNFLMQEMPISWKN